MSWFFFNCSNIRLLYTTLAQKKSYLCKGKSVSSYPGILYPAPKISNQNLNFKLCWRKILPLAPRSYFLLAPTRIFLGIGDSWILFWGIPIFFSLLWFTVLLLFWETTWMVKWWKWWYGEMVKQILNGKMAFGGSSLLSPVGVYYDYPFLGNCIGGINRQNNNSGLN